MAGEQFPPKLSLTLLRISFSKSKNLPKTTPSWNESRSAWEGPIGDVSTLPRSSAEHASTRASASEVRIDEREGKFPNAFSSGSCVGMVVVIFYCRLPLAAAQKVRCHRHGLESRPFRPNASSFPAARFPATWKRWRCRSRCTIRNARGTGTGRDHRLLAGCGQGFIVRREHSRSSFREPGVGPDRSASPEVNGKCDGIKIDTRPDVLQVGQAVPDFRFTDQSGQRVSLTQFKGQGRRRHFIYTRCPLPNYCVRLVQQSRRCCRGVSRIAMGSDLCSSRSSLIPVHDQPEALANYARTWKADARTWHFLTGSVSDIRQLCHKFDMDFYPDEALLVHSFHTVVIDRSGKLAANLEGNNFTGQQLGDLVQTVMASAQFALKTLRPR